MRKHALTSPLFALVVLAALILSACGSAAPAAPTTAPAPTAAPAAEPTKAPEPTTAPEPTKVPEPTAVPAAEPTKAPDTMAMADYKGVTINILTFTGPQIAEPLQRHGKEFAEMTGATVNVTTVPFADLYQKILTDLSTGTNSFDAYVFAPQWMGDYVTPGYLADLTTLVKTNKELAWDDVGPFFRDFSATYGGKVYTIPLDGDFHMVYYRTDILEQLKLSPPNTWDEYLAIAKAVKAAGLKNDAGKEIYGSCIAKARNQQSYWFITSVASAFLQSKGTSQGAFFDPDTMAPLTNNEGFAKALEVYKATTEFGPADELNLGVGDTRGLWTGGQCALTMDWGDIGTLAIAKDSKVNDKTGAVILPGSDMVVDRATGKLVKCDATTCPYAVDGVNHAPFAAFGGWSGGINNSIDDKKKEAVLAYLSYVSAPANSNVDVTVGATGFNPYRTSQFSSLDAWKKAGMSETAANLYLGAIKASLNSPNMVLDLRIPQNQYYQQVVLDTAVSQFLAGEISVDEAMKDITDKWDEKNQEIGLDAQKAAYVGSLGVQK